MPRRKDTTRYTSLSTARDRSGATQRGGDDEGWDADDDEVLQSAGESEYEEEGPRGGRRRASSSASSSTPKRNAKRQKTSADDTPAVAAGPPRVFNRPRLKFKKLNNKDVVEVVAGYKKDPLGLCDAREYTYLPSMAPDQASFRADKDAQAGLRDELHAALNAAQVPLGAEEMKPAKFRSTVLTQLDKHANGPFEPFQTGVPVMQLPETSVKAPNSSTIIIAGGMRQTFTFVVDDYEPVNVSDSDFSNMYGDRRPANYEEILASTDAGYRSLCYHHGQAVLAADASASERDASWLEDYTARMEEAKKEAAKVVPEEVGAAIYTYDDMPPMLLLQHYVDGRQVESRGVLGHAIEREAKDVDEDKTKNWFKWARKIEDDVGKLSWDQALRRLKEGREGWEYEAKENEGYDDEWVKQWKNWTPAHVALMTTITEATHANPIHEASYIEGGRTANVAERRQIFEHVEKVIEVVEREDGKQTYKVHSHSLGGVILEGVMPSTAEEFDQQVIDLKRCLSADHGYQMAPMLKNGKIVLRMNNPKNIIIVDWTMNRIKHRYNGTIHGLQLLALQNTAKRGKGFIGDVEKDKHLIAGTARVGRLAYSTYTAHIMPCSIALRVQLPPSIAIHVIDADHELMDCIGIGYFKPLPTVEDLVPLPRAQIIDLADQDLQDRTNRQFAKNGRVLNLEQEYPVRPGSNLKHTVYGQTADDFIQVTVQLDAGAPDPADFRKHGVVFRKTSDGLGFAISMEGKETLTDVIQMFLRWDGFKLKTAAGCEKHVTAYASCMCYVYNSITQGGSIEFDPPREFVFHDPLLPGLPLVCRPDSKGAFAPSLCRLDHTLPHRMGYTNESVSHLTLENYKAELNNVRLGSWTGNLVDGEGDAEQVKANQRAALQSVATAQRDGGAGPLNEGAFWVIDDFGPSGNEREQEVVDCTAQIKSRRPKAPMPTVAFNPPVHGDPPGPRTRRPAGAFLSAEFVDSDDDADDLADDEHVELLNAGEDGWDDADEEDF
ncbi:hypothetical protein JCM10213_007167 [Rhodosporidiobolus nylandii]